MVSEMLSPDKTYPGLFLSDDTVVDCLWLTEWDDRTQHIQAIVPASLQTLQSAVANRILFESEMVWILGQAMNRHWLHSNSSSDLLQPLLLYQILEEVISVPSFRLEAQVKQENLSEFYAYRACAITDPLLYGYTPLMMALHCGMKPAVEILVKAGASIQAKTQSGISPLELSKNNAESRHPRIWARWDGPPERRPGTCGTCANCRAWEDALHALAVPASIDEEMLEILLEALKDRGESLILVTSPTIFRKLATAIARVSKLSCP
jgi:hypothetical protein